MEQNVLLGRKLLQGAMFVVLAAAFLLSACTSGDPVASDTATPVPVATDVPATSTVSTDPVEPTSTPVPVVPELSVADVEAFVFAEYQQFLGDREEQGNPKIVESSVSTVVIEDCVWLPTTVRNVGRTMTYSLEAGETSDESVVVTNARRQTGDECLSQVMFDSIVEFQKEVNSWADSAFADPDPNDGRIADFYMPDAAGSIRDTLGVLDELQLYALSTSSWPKDSSVGSLDLVAWAYLDDGDADDFMWLAVCELHELDFGGYDQEGIRVAERPEDNEGDAHLVVFRSHREADHPNGWREAGRFESTWTDQCGDDAAFMGAVEELKPWPSFALLDR